jgi:hypothetical protein
MGSTTFTDGAVTGTAGDLVRLGPLRFWAERGLIHIEDERDNSYEVISVRTCLHRLRSIQDMLNNSRRVPYTEDQFDQANRQRLQDYLDAMIEVCRKAQQQGMPSDASARRDLVRRRPLSLVMPGYGGGL